jgi:diguanylate cyclase (GGDEF)-like protein
VEGRFRSRYGRVAVARAAIVVFLLFCALIAGVVFTLDLSARRSNDQEAATELASTARVAASSFSTMHANLRARVGELAASGALEQALLHHDGKRLQAFAVGHDARVVTHSHAYGMVPGGPGIAATATITRRGRPVARVTMAVPMNQALLTVLQRATPMPKHAALLLVADGRVLAGGKAGSAVTIAGGKLTMERTPFLAKAVPFGAGGASVVSVEPISAVHARLSAYRRRLLFAAAITLALAAGLATRLARPVARVLADLARLTHQSQTDALTNIANRRALDERLDAEVDHARRLGTSVAFLIADIDNFKSINDRFGHQTGDEVLRRVAAVFADAVRVLDLPGRYGGEEIAVVAPGTNLSGARAMADKIRGRIEELELRSPDGEVFPVTVSFGAACYPAQRSVEELVAAADAALYEAKRNGKNRVVTATAKRRPRGHASAGEAPVSA